MSSSEFQDWIGLFEEWQKDIGFPQDLIDEVLKDHVQFEFKHKFGDLSSNLIDFGDYAGLAKWKTIMQVPDQRIRDALLHLIVYQGDTEFASVEQQRNLVKNAPSDYDLLSLTRVMSEEMRHGWQMTLRGARRRMRRRRNGLARATNLPTSGWPAKSGIKSDGFG